jgi:hypothetical protein
VVTFQQELRPALTTSYEIAGRVLSVVASDDWGARWAEQFIAAWRLERVAAGTDLEAACTLAIRRGTPPAVPSGYRRFEVPHGFCYTNQETSYLIVGRSAVIVRPTPARLIEIWVEEAPGAQSTVALARLFFYGAHAALRRCGLYELHAAGVLHPSDGTAGALIIGASGSGKTTLAVRLAQSGWRYLTDDLILLCKRAGGAVEARGLRRVFSLTETTLAACDPPRVGEATQAPRDFDPDKRRLEPQVMFPTGFVEGCVPRTLFFPSVTEEAASSVVRLAHHEALAQLLRLCPWSCYDAPVAHQYLRVLSLLAKQSNAYQLNSGRDILQQPDLASELLSSHMRA